jgi:molybdenum cofactor cytidylyltransferase
MSSNQKSLISAIVLAAGLSSRMGVNKQLLPYGQHSVIEQIVSSLLSCPLHEIVVITGHERPALEAKLAGWQVRTAINQNYHQGEMLSSVQSGLSALSAEVKAALIVLGDQPQLEPVVIRQLVEAYLAEPAGLVIPSYRLRRGHPILIERSYWPEILALGPNQILRDLLIVHAAEIRYVNVETDSVLRDIDTPEEYRRELHRLSKQDNSDT